MTFSLFMNNFCQESELSYMKKSVIIIAKHWKKMKQKFFECQK